MKSILTFIIFFCISAVSLLHAASTLVIWSNSSGTELKDLLGTPLSQGTSIDGDGAVLQLGYYSTATIANPFSGVWFPLTGPNSGNGIPSTIGDKAVSLAGRFDISNGFIAGTITEPPIGTPLSIRFYDSASISASNFFNAVSDIGGDWNWKSPSDPTAQVIISLTSSSLIWQDGSGSAFRTTIDVVPEPSSIALLIFGSGLLIFHRKHRRI